MKLLGLNSPEIFIILVILLSILGPKRIEKGFLLFKKLLKFLLSKDEDQNLANIKAKSEEAEESEANEKIVEAEAKAEEAEESEVEEEIVKSEVETDEAVESEVEEEIVEAEANAEEAEESEVNEEIIEPGLKFNPKERIVKDKIIDVKVDSDN